MPRVRLTRLALDHRDAPQNDVGAEALVHPGQQEGRRRDVEEEGFEYRSGFEPVGWGRVPIEAQIAHDERALRAIQEPFRTNITVRDEPPHRLLRQSQR